jgi:DNA-binding Xre family transcriptional regulator
MARKLNFHWNLRQLMAAHEIWKTTELIPLLAERGVVLSTAQVYRLVTDKPERLSMKTLIALCDILSCTPADLIDPFVEASSRKPAVGDTNVVDVHPVTAFRPVRARIVDDE